MTLLRWLRPTLLDRYVAREIWPPDRPGPAALHVHPAPRPDLEPDEGAGLAGSGPRPPSSARSRTCCRASSRSPSPWPSCSGCCWPSAGWPATARSWPCGRAGSAPLSLLRPVVALSARHRLPHLLRLRRARPAANQAYREIIFALIVSRARNDVQPRVFNDDLIPGGTMVLYVSDIAAETGSGRTSSSTTPGTPSSRR